MRDDAQTSAKKIMTDAKRPELMEWAEYY